MKQVRRCQCLSVADAAMTKFKHTWPTDRGTLFKAPTAKFCTGRPGFLEKPFGVYVLTSWRQCCGKIIANHKMVHPQGANSLQVNPPPSPTAVHDLVATNSTAEYLNVSAAGYGQWILSHWCWTLVATLQNNVTILAVMLTVSIRSPTPDGREWWA